GGNDEKAARSRRARLQRRSHLPDASPGPRPPGRRADTDHTRRAKSSRIRPIPGVPRAAREPPSGFDLAGEDEIGGAGESNVAPGFAVVAEADFEGFAAADREAHRGR